MASEADKLLEFTYYYKNLYDTSKPYKVKIPAFLEKINLPSLSDQLLENMDKPVTIEKVQTVIDKLKRNQAPGPDGLRAECYEAYKDELS